MIYIDSNVFIFAALNNEELGDSARVISEEVENGNPEALTSALTFDEVILIVKKNRNFEDAISLGEAFLNMPGLYLVNVNQDLLAISISIMRTYKTVPRYSIHAATSITQKANIIISEDTNFNKIKELERKGVIEFKMP